MDIHILSEEYLELLNQERNYVELNNILEGFNTVFIALGLANEKIPFVITIMYAGTSGKKITGYQIELDVREKGLSLKVAEFARYLDGKLDDIREIRLSNTILNKITQLLEAKGVICVSSEFISNVKNALFISNTKHSIVIIDLIDEVVFHRSFFEVDNYIDDGQIGRAHV